MIIAQQTLKSKQETTTSLDMRCGIRKPKTYKVTKAQRHKAAEVQREKGKMNL